MTNINLLSVWALVRQPQGFFHIKGIHWPTPYRIPTFTWKDYHIVFKMTTFNIVLFNFMYFRI
jgi:hypothetical protein